MDLPEELQLAPVMAFASGSKQTGTFLGVGNFYGVTPYEGRYDALYPTLFSFDKDKKVFNELYNFGDINGEMRDAKWLNYAGGGKILVLARNNNTLIFLKPKS